jgi:predicted nucleic acid-binding Zn ribbon protein
VSRRAPRRLSLAVGELSATLAPATMLAHVQEMWAATVGEAIADSARPTGERGGVLTITCSAAVWAQELKLMEGELIPRLNLALGAEAIRELRCRTA